jgi:hypothetical protein
MKGLKQAAELAHELDHLEAGKLTAEGFLEEAMKAADAGPNRLGMLAEIIQKPEFEAIPRLVRIIIKNILDGRVSTIPPAERLSQIVRTWGGTEVSAQLTAIGSSEAEAFALAVREASERHPEVFGDVPDWAAHVARLDAVQEQYSEAVAALDFKSADLIIGDEVSFKCTGGAVLLSDGWRQKLVDWKLAQPSKIAA